MQNHALCLFLSINVIILTGNNAAAQDKKPLKIFILAGQSNMQGHAHVKTIEAMRWNPHTAAILQEMREPDGTPRLYDQIWISSIGTAETIQSGRLSVGFGAKAGGPKIGPEFTFGIYAHMLLNEPILLIKTAWGGKSLNTDFRPPSAGPYEFNELQLKQFQDQKKDLEQLRKDKINKTGHFYRLMLEHTKAVVNDIQMVYPEYDPQQGYELAGFVWFQGWNDMVDSGTYPSRENPEGYEQYSQLMAHFIRDVRKDLNCPNLPFVIGVMGVGGPTDLYGPAQKRYKNVHQNFRDAMAAPASLPEFKGNVATVLTENFWDLELVQLREREKSLNPRLIEIANAVTENRLSKEEGQTQINNSYNEIFNDRELVILRESTSNAEFHYLGSARIMAQIGKAFAEALVALGR